MVESESPSPDCPSVEASGSSGVSSSCSSDKTPPSVGASEKDDTVSPAQDDVPSSSPGVEALAGSWAPAGVGAMMSGRRRQLDDESSAMGATAGGELRLG